MTDEEREGARKILRGVSAARPAPSGARREAQREKHGSASERRRLMAAPMERTRHPGIHKRGTRYVVIYRAGVKQRKESHGR